MIDSGGNIAISGGSIRVMWVDTSADSTPRDLTITNGKDTSGWGGGIYVNGISATIKNTIIADSPGGGDCVHVSGGVSENNNLIEDSTNACGLTHGVNGNIIGQDLQLGILTGSPAYFPLNLGSPVIDAGANTGCPLTDQRSVVRPQDGDGNGAAICGIVAYKAPPPQMPDLTVIKSNTLGKAITADNPFAWTVTIANSGAANATFTSGQIILQDDLPAGPTYGTPTVQNLVNATGRGTIACAIASNTLICTASVSPMALGATTGVFDVAFSVTPTVTGILTNPASGSGNACRADPNGAIIESD